MIAHLGITLRLGLRAPAEDQQLLRAVRDAMPGVQLNQLSPGRWQLHGSAWIDQMTLQRQRWASGEAWQVDWLLSATAHQHGRNHDCRYLGEAWMLQVAETLLRDDASAMVALTRGDIWEDGIVDTLQSLDLPGFEGALLLGPRLRAAVQSLQPAYQRSPSGQRWLISDHWFTEPWRAQEARLKRHSLPWMWMPWRENLEFEACADAFAWLPKAFLNH